MDQVVNSITRRFNHQAILAAAAQANLPKEEVDRIKTQGLNSFSDNMAEDEEKTVF